MKYQHQKLAAGQWQNLSFAEQMANIGSEIERTILWRNKKNHPFSRRAFIRALELLDLSISFSKKFSYLRELTRLREVLIDYFWGKNHYSSSDQLWRRYFNAFNYKARINT